MTRNPNVTILTKEEYAIAKENGINRQTACSRVRDLKWDVQTAITKKPEKPVFFTDEELAIMKKNKLSVRLVRARLKYYNFTRERAISEPVPYRILH